MAARTVPHPMSIDSARYPRLSRIDSPADLRRVDDGIGIPHFDEHGNPVDDELHCCVTDHPFERPDMIASAQRGPNGEVQYISSLALSTDRTGEHVLPADEHARLTARESRRLRGK